jgi:hypothetical protein
MFILCADRSLPGWSGIVGREQFDTLAEAEAKMREWARFGVDGHCNDPDHLWITDDRGEVLMVWDWRRRTPVEPARTEDEAARA